MKRLSNQSGFSLIELMVVVAIIGILSAIGIPQYSKFQAKTRQSEAKSALGTLFTAEKSFQIEWSSFTCDLANAGFGIEGNTLRYDLGFPGACPTAGYPTTSAPAEETARSVASARFPTGSGWVSPALAAPGGVGFTPLTPVAARTPTATSFIAVAWGSPNSAACTTGGSAASVTRCDEWTIDQGKVIRNPISGVW